MREGITVRVETPHTPGCLNQLIYLPGSRPYQQRGLAATVLRDSRGRHHRHAWRSWLPLICNDGDCDAVVLVREDLLYAAATALLGGGTEVAVVDLPQADENGHHYAHPNTHTKVWGEVGPFGPRVCAGIPGYEFQSRSPQNARAFAAALLAAADVAEAVR